MTNAIAQIFDKPSNLPNMLHDALKDIDPLGAAVNKLGADSIKTVAKTPLLSAAATGVAGYFGGPWGAAAASSTLSRERGEDWGSTLRGAALSGAATYAAGQLGAGDAGADVGGGVDSYGNPVNGTSNYSGGGADTTDYGGTQAPTAPEPSVTPTGATTVDAAADPRAGETAKAAATEAPKTPAKPDGPVSSTLKQIGTGLAVSSILAGKKPDQPTPTVSPVTPMPDPLAQEAARRRALVEQIMRRGRTSTILTDSRGY